MQPHHKTLKLIIIIIIIIISCHKHYTFKNAFKQEVVRVNQGLSQAAPLRQSRTAIGIVPLKKGQGDNLSPSKFREKTRKEAHTKRFISVQKLQVETERGKYILSHL